MTSTAVAAFLMAVGLVPQPAEAGRSESERMAAALRADFTERNNTLYDIIIKWSNATMAAAGCDCPNDRKCLLQEFLTRELDAYSEKYRIDLITKYENFRIMYPNSDLGTAI
jgi:hypothetical protein